MLIFRVRVPVGALSEAETVAFVESDTDVFFRA